MAEHRNNYTGENWFNDYRWEIRYISKYMYKHIPWAKELWEDMNNADKNIYSTINYYPYESIKGYLTHNIKVHNEPPAIESKAFPNTLVLQFCKDTAIEFKNWLEKEKITI